MSKKVDDLLSKSLDKRNELSYLQTLRFSNDELLEIFEKTENKEEEKDPSRPLTKLFYSNLIQSQPGPFSPEVYDAYNTFVVFRENAYEGLMSLFRKTQGLSTQAKNDWLTYIIRSSEVSLEFVMSPEIKAEYNIDIHKNPYNVTVMVALMSYDNVRHKYQGMLAIHYFKEYVAEIFDTLPYNEQFDRFHEATLYLQDIKQIEILVPVLSLCKNLSPELIASIFPRIKSPLKRELTRNCSLEQKIEIYKKTGDSSVLPRDVTELFVF